MAVPEISIRLSLSPLTYHFSNPVAPELSLTVTSDAEEAFIFFTWSTLFNPRHALVRNCFVITDLTTGFEVSQPHNICTNRGPFKRFRGCDDEKYLLTIEPGVPKVISFSFGGHRPLPKGSERDGNIIRIAISVDGLEPGHRYRLDVAEGPLRMWWRWGTKDDILVDRSDVENRLLRSLKPEKLMPKFTPVEGIEFCVEE
ncbi:MAG: hypothetical protein Q9221_006323 [Calogaya cf. arnoldii]